MSQSRKHFGSDEQSAPAKKSKLGSTLSFSNQPIIPITIENGNESRNFNIHQNLLTNNFEDFREKLEFVEEPKPLVLRNVYFETFETVAQWLYTKQLAIAYHQEAMKNPVEQFVEGHHCEPPNNDAEVDGGTRRMETLPWYMLESTNYFTQVVGRIVDIYVFAVFYKSAELRRTAMLALQRFMARTKRIPCLRTVKEAVDKLTIDTALCQWLARVITMTHLPEWSTEAERKALPRGFLGEVLKLTLILRDKRELVKHYNEDWCDYHEHQDEKDRIECQNSRKGDADMVYQVSANKKGRGFRRLYTSKGTIAALDPEPSAESLSNEDLIQRLASRSEWAIADICERAKQHGRVRPASRTASTTRSSHTARHSFEFKSR